MKRTEIARWLALVAVLLITLYVCWLMLQPFLDVLLWAGVLATVFMPVHHRIQTRVTHPGLSAAVSTALVILTVLLPVTLITLAVVNQLSSAVVNLQAASSYLPDRHSPVLGPALDFISRYIDLNRFLSQDFLVSRVQTLGQGIASRTLGVVGGVVSALVQTVLVVFTMYYLFRDGDSIRRAVYDVLPLEREQSHDVIVRTKEVIEATIYGVLFIASIQGALGTFIFWALGLPSPLLWGVVMFFLSMIPMAGSFIVWAPTALFLAVTGAWTRAVILVAWGVIVIGSIDNFLSPRVVGSRTRMHELLIFFSVLGGIDVFGVLGVVLGPVVVALALALVEIVREANRPPAETRREETVIERQADIRQTAN
jgi:predicted PurR-regulated permease PerM